MTKSDQASLPRDFFVDGALSDAPIPLIDVCKINKEYINHKWRVLIDFAWEREILYSWSLLSERRIYLFDENISYLKSIDSIDEEVDFFKPFLIYDYTDLIISAYHSDISVISAPHIFWNDILEMDERQVEEAIKDFVNNERGSVYKGAVLKLIEKVNVFNISLDK